MGITKEVIVQWLWWRADECLDGNSPTDDDDDPTDANLDENPSTDDVDDEYLQLNK